MKFTFTQASPSATWTVTHPLNGYPAFDVITNYLGADQKIMPQSVTYNNPGQITIKFSMPVAGSVSMVGPYAFALSTAAMTDRSDTPLASETV